MRASKVRLLLPLLVLPLQLASAQVKLVWGPAPAVFPAGAKMAVLQGDPSKNELFTVRLDMPDGYKIAPHWHPTDEHVTVITGHFMVGMGDKMDMTGMKDAMGKKESMGKMDMSKMTTLAAGDFISAPANAHHYAMARGHTVVQVHGMGPFQLTYVHPEDDPSHAAAPPAK